MKSPWLLGRSVRCDDYDILEFVRRRRPLARTSVRRRERRV